MVISQYRRYFKKMQTLLMNRHDGHFDRFFSKIKESEKIVKK